MECNTTFSWPFMQTIKVSIVTENNALVSGIPGEQFRPEMMVPQISKEATKTLEGLIFSLPASIQGKQYNMKDRGSRNRRVELKNTVTH